MRLLVVATNVAGDVAIRHYRTNVACVFKGDDKTTSTNAVVEKLIVFDHRDKTINRIIIFDQDHGQGYVLDAISIEEINDQLNKETLALRQNSSSYMRTACVVDVISSCDPLRIQYRNNFNIELLRKKDSSSF